MQESRVDFVLGLGRKSAQHEIFRLDGIIESCRYELDFLVKENIKLADRLAAVMDRDSDRFDALLLKQEEILDQRLGLGVPPAPTKATMQPVHGRNRNWRGDFEKKQREEHWRKVIEVQENADKARANASEPMKTEKAE